MSYERSEHTVELLKVLHGVPGIFLVHYFCQFLLWIFPPSEHPQTSSPPNVCQLRVTAHGLFVVTYLLASTPMMPLELKTNVSTVFF